MHPGPPLRQGRCRRIDGPGRQPRGRTLHERSARSRARSMRVVVLEWTDFDRERRQHCGELVSPIERSVEIGRPDNRESAEVFLPLGVRAVGDERFAVVDAHNGCGTRVVQAAGEDPRAGALHLVAEGMDIAHDPLQIEVGWWRSVGLVDAQQILFHWSPFLTSYTNGSARIDRQYHVLVIFRGAACASTSLPSL